MKKLMMTFILFLLRRTFLSELRNNMDPERNSHFMNAWNNLVALK